MTPEMIEHVQSSWEKVKPIRDTAAKLFYGRLFELDPSLEKLFSNDMEEQGKKLMTMLGTAVAGLKNLEAIVPAVEALGKRHVDYGVEPAHYNTVGAALVWTLSQGLGEDFTDEVEAAWVATYDALATMMKKAAAA